MIIAFDGSFIKGGRNKECSRATEVTGSQSGPYVGSLKKKREYIKPIWGQSRIPGTASSQRCKPQRTGKKNGIIR
jgi:hypothetical protein